MAEQSRGPYRPGSPSTAGMYSQVDQTRQRTLTRPPSPRGNTIPPEPTPGEHPGYRPAGSLPVRSVSPVGPRRGAFTVVDDEPTLVDHSLRSDPEEEELEARAPRVVSQPPARREQPSIDREPSGPIPPPPRMPTFEPTPLPTSSPPPPAPTQALETQQPGANSQVTVIATHDELPEGATQHWPFIEDADSPIAASFRLLRRRLREVGGPRTIVITSPARQEGKTIFAINLAMAFAEQGRGKVLLVEANLRAPAVTTALGLTKWSCFAQQMAKHRTNPQAPWEVVSAYFPNLHVLSVDPSVNGQWLLNGPTFEQAMEQLKASGYHQIIIDCPPALGSADVNVIADSADGVLFTAMTGKTSCAALRNAAKHLAPARILGTILVDG